MRKFEIFDPEIMRIAVQKEILRSEESRYDHRLHGILLITQGLNGCDVADILGKDPCTGERWVHRFEKSGFEGPHDGEREGRQRRLSESLCEAINGDLQRSPRDFAPAQNLWEGKRLSRHLRKLHSVDLGVRQCQRIFRQPEFRLRKPRPLAVHAEPAARAASKGLRRLARDESIEWWSLDECHFRQHGSRCTM